MRELSGQSALCRAVPRTERLVTLVNSKRRFLIGALAVGALGSGLSIVFAQQSSSDVIKLSPPEALAAVRDGKLVLVDVRRPDEWAQTGIAEGAVPIDMRRPDFIAAVEDAASLQPGVPIAFICARGVRSRRVTRMMETAGLNNIVDIPEGMLGSFAGPGWLDRGLPVVTFEG